ncbi:MAG: RdgB/HAM1 family non-canonical purine NTP pyrophosphatase [Clostridia bacterium]|nr:RdgB/HAM1 family non-canonical purine NTP pyrophosphatase [Clostridia bacterium]
MNKIIMATNNEGKIRELKKLLSKYEILSQKEAGIEDLDVEENGETFEENAIIKVNSIKDLVGTNVYIIAEDSGICVEALNGYPGTKTKRAASEELGREVSNEERNTIILEKMVNNTNRKIIWQTVIALIDDDGSIKTFKGEVEGKVAEKLAGENGFGFDPLFYIEEENKTLAQMSFEEKENYSARKRAVEKLIKYLEEKN